MECTGCITVLGRAGPVRCLILQAANIQTHDANVPYQTITLSRLGLPAVGQTPEGIV